MSNIKRTNIVLNKRNASHVDANRVSLLERNVPLRDPIYRHIGSVIKARRKTLEIMQKTLAGQLGISRGALANIEVGRQNVLVHQLYKIATALQLHPFDLLPQPTADATKANRTELPLPEDLKPQQKEEVVRFFSGVATDNTSTKGESHATKTTKR